MSSDEQAAYERGRTEGEIQQRLSGHDQHFARLNGNLRGVQDALAELTLAVTRVSDKQESLIDTSAAIRDALRRAGDRRWSLWQKIFTVVGVLTALAGIYLAWRTGHH